ncbi:MAG: putative Ser/Thr protein kinase, partial [Bradymonadia bacterium]
MTTAETGGGAGSPGAGAGASAAETIAGLAGSLRQSFETDNRLLSFDQFLALVVENPGRFARNSAQYLLDAVQYFGAEEVVTSTGKLKRHLLFDAPFEDGADRVVGNETTQAALVRALSHFVRERRINRLILVHGPNGSAKSSLVSCLMRALQAYSNTEEGALYRFNWVFPSTNLEGARIGFGGNGLTGTASDSYAFLDDEFIDSKLPSEHNDNPLFLLPATERLALLEAALGASDFVLSDTIAKGDLGQRSRAVYDALLVSYRGGFDELLRHVQVERFFISKRYRRGAVSVEPQLRVDAAVRQLTADRSLNALPRVLQTQTLFEPHGPLVEGNRGIVEYNDILKRPMDSNKYLLSTSEKGTVSLETGEMHIDTVLIATANEKYLEAFKHSPDWPSYKARFSLVRMPYLLDYNAEQQIYDGQLAELKLTKPTAPHTTFVAALWAVLTRLVKPDCDEFDSSIQKIISEMSPLQKALIYADGTLPSGLTA